MKSCMDIDDVRIYLRIETGGVFYSLPIPRKDNKPNGILRLARQIYI